MKQSDFAICESERLGFTNQIQDYGVLVVVDTELQYPVMASANLGLVGLPKIDELRKMRPQEFLNANEQYFLEAARKEEKTRFLEKIRSHKHINYDLSIHLSGNVIILSWEPSETAELAQVKPYSWQNLTIEESLNEVLNAAEAIQAADRWMIYQFQEDRSGVVIGEINRSCPNSYLGLRYPATDIPEVARALYIRNRIRFIADTNSKNTELVQLKTSTQIDFSKSNLHSVSPFHIRYLNNMNIRTSLSVSITVGNKLWGLLSLHNISPLYISVSRRNQLIQLGKAVSHCITQNALNHSLNFFDRLLIHAKQFVSATTAKEPSEADAKKIDHISHLMKANSFALRNQHGWVSSGEAVNQDLLDRIYDSLRKRGNSGTHASDYIAGSIDCTTLDTKMCGFIATWQFDRERASGECYIWLRGEAIQNVSWGSKTTFKASDQGTLSPETSFGIWQDSIKNHSEPWGREEKHIALAVLRAMKER